MFSNGEWYSTPLRKLAFDSSRAEMALIPPSYLNAVVALGAQDADGIVQFTATGFLYGYPGDLDPEDGQPLYATFLVTNRHVFESPRELVVRFNRPVTSSSSIVPLPLLRNDGSEPWTVHPEGDVAVIPISMRTLEEEGIEFSHFLGGKNTLSRQQDQAKEISEGDGIFVLGFPLGLAGDERNYTIVRQGVIARIQDWIQGSEREFLIDASVFPGNSGGPVLTKPELAAIRGTKSNRQSLLIGMISGYIPYEDIAISQQSGEERVRFRENSGLAVVVPTDVIQETVEIAVKKEQTRQQGRAHS